MRSRRGACEDFEKAKVLNVADAQEALAKYCK